MVKLFKREWIRIVSIVMMVIVFVVMKILT